MIKLYYSPGACSLAPHIALEETGQRYEAEQVLIAAGENRSPAYLSVNPSGRVPSLSVGDAVITEGPAVLAYIARRFPEADLFLSYDPTLYGKVHELLAFCASCVHIAFAQLWRPERFVEDAAQNPHVIAAGRAALGRYFDDLENRARVGEWFVGDRFSAADTYPFVFSRWARRIGTDLARYPAWTAHSRRMLARPAVQRALANEGLDASEFIPAATSPG